MAASSVYVPQGELQPTPISPGDSARSAGRSGPCYYQITAFALGCQHVRFCVCPLREKTLFPQSCGSLERSPLVFGAKCSGFLSFQCRTSGAGEPDMGLKTLTTVEELLQYNYSPVCGSPLPQGYGLDYITSLPLLHGSLWFLLYVFSGRSSMVGSGLFH